MPPVQTLTTAQGRLLAYHQTTGIGSGVIFLGGYRSDMGGTKAVALEAWAKARGRAFLRFDYGGHGGSGGDFTELGIADWLDDARAALNLTQGPQVLVGSSMGGWLALLLARACPERIAGLIGIAAAPDFTEDSLLPSLTVVERAAMDRVGLIERPSGYSDGPYIFTQRLIDQGRANLVLRAPLALPFPTRFLQGTADTDVPVAVAQQLFDHASGPDIRLTLVKGADHRFSTPDCLALIESSLDEILA
jgi:pimeloyl-ACP methyl ester carboxylesterase